MPPALRASSILSALVILPLLSATPAVAGPSPRQGPAFTRLTVSGGHGQAIHLMPPPLAGRGAEPPPAPPAGSHVSYGGGPVVHTLKAYAIFWQPPGYHFEEAFKKGSVPDSHDTSYETLIDGFFQHAGATPYYNILTQYSDTSDVVHNALSFGGMWVDTGALNQFNTSVDGTQKHPLLNSDIQAEVENAVAKNSTWPTGGMGVEFFVFTPGGVQSCTTSALTYCDAEFPYPADAYCAYHSAFYNSGATPVLYANMFDAGYSTACGGPNWTVNGTHYPPIDGPGPNGDPVADYEISPMSHEMSETITDPMPNSGWVDSSDGYEIGDICAYVFAPLSTQNGDVTLHGHQYLIQEEWSNAVGPGQTAANCLMAYHRAASLPVNSAADASPGGTTPLCPNTPGGDSGSTSSYLLRCAVDDANNDALAGTVNHLITFAGCPKPCAISLQAPLPWLSASGLAIYGGGYTTLNGHKSVAVGLRDVASHTTVRGMTIENFAGPGVDITSKATGVMIGGTGPNTIINNSGYSVVVGASTSDAVAAVISRNRMYGNGNGIYLAGLAPASCASGLSGSPNGYLACPAITSALPTLVTGTSSCVSSCTVELFAVPSTPDKSGHGQAQTFLGSGTTNATGAWTVTPAKAPTAGSRVTATVTNTTTGQTSEFAADQSVT
ncbi:MAG TPA: right-handed parallel beta-helix repeat-containing protein [Chloroflexota bacterium]|nr:right-handed parallel beta-helix repeat-containing protein [Chloroflexota bacterium]